MAKLMAFALALFVCAVSSTAAMATCSWTTLTNGSTADAAQVMNNFDCLAPLASPTFTGTITADVATFSGNLTVDNAGAQSPGAVIIGNASTSNGAAVKFLGASGQHNWLFGHQINVSDALEVTPSTTTGGTTFTTPVAAFTPSSFLVGTTASGGWGGDSKVEAVTTTGAGISGYATTAGGQALRANVDSTSASLLSFYYNHTGSAISNWSTNGSTSTFNNPSDERLKNIVAEQFNYGDAIKKMWVGDYSWKINGAHDFGGTAQNIYAALAGSPIRDVVVTKPKTANDKWMVASDYYGRLALWGVKDIYAKSDKLEKDNTSLARQVAELRREVTSLEARLLAKTASN